MVAAKSSQFSEGPVMAPMATNSIIENGATYTIYGAGVTGIWATDPLTAINWQITNPEIGLDSIKTAQEMISFTFQSLGTYKIRAFNPPPYGFEWFMTVKIVNSLEDALIVQPDFIRSENLSGNTFRYYWRVNKPATLSGSEDIFRCFGFSETLYDPFPVFYNQIYFYGSDSIEWYLDIDGEGRAKTNGGYRNSAGKEMWFVIDTSSTWISQDIVDYNVIEFNFYYGLVGVLETNFSLPDNISSNGDHGKDVPVVLIGLINSSGSIPFYLLSSPETTVWRHRLNDGTEWTNENATRVNGRINILLPAHHDFGQRVTQYGHYDENNIFVPDPYMELSSLYNSTVKGLHFAY